MFPLSCLFGLSQKRKLPLCHSLLITCLCSTLPVGHAPSSDQTPYTCLCFILPVNHAFSSGQLSTPVTAWLQLSLLLSLRQGQIVLCYAWSPVADLVCPWPACLVPVLDTTAAFCLWPRVWSPVADLVCPWPAYPWHSAQKVMRKPLKKQFQWEVLWMGTTKHHWSL